MTAADGPEFCDPECTDEVFLKHLEEKAATITQNTVITLARDLGFDCVLDNLARSDLYIADEMFLVGTAAEVSSVNSVDDRTIPCPGPKTQAIADLYGRVVRGQEDQYKDWCELAV